MIEEKGIYERAYGWAGVPVDESEKIHILSTKHTGLGDYLRLSTLPEMYTKAGYDVYLHEYAKFNNDGIKKLIVDHNPYILGYVRIPTNWYIYTDYPNGLENIPKRHRNGISNLEMHHGFEPTNTKPKIYYDAELISDHQDIVLVDMGSISAEYKEPHNLKELIEKVKKLQETKFKRKKLVQVVHSSDLMQNNTKNFPNLDPLPYTNRIILDDTITVSSIFHYCDLMRSCCGVIALDSGASHLASAMQRQNPDLQSVCLMHDKTYHRFVKESLLINENTDYILLESSYNRV